MSNFAKQAAMQSLTPAGPVETKAKKRTVTHEGGDAFVFKAKSELFLTAISTLMGEDNFYETANDRRERIVQLTHQVTAKDPEWIQAFVPWLRGTANLRTVSICIAVEYVYAGGPNGRQVISAACQRADEPAEVIAYISLFHYGYKKVAFPAPSPRIPQAIRKGLGDAVRRLWNEYSVMKYNGNSRNVNMAHVLNLIHAKPDENKPWQGDLFKYIIDREYENDLEFTGLEKIARQHSLREVPEADRRAMLSANLVNESGMTWEQLSGWIPGGMDAAAWEAMIPTLGYMALLRNLRNFDQAGISDAVTDTVIARLTNPEEVAKSRQLPFRFLSAYLNTDSDNWRKALGKALDLSTLNIEGFTGSTLILVDISGSMGGGYYYGEQKGRGVQATPWQKAALFGASLWKRSQSVGGEATLVAFGTNSAVRTPKKTQAVLSAVSLFDPATRENNALGWGTNMWEAVKRHYNGHDRVVIFTDMQTADNASGSISKIPFIHMFDLGGYGKTPMRSGQGDGRFHYGGFSDATFKLMSILEARSAGWPWEV